MTDTDIVTRLAREAGMDYRSPWATGDDEMHRPGMDGVDRETLARFAALVAEECAKVCDRRYMGDNNREDMEARRCADAIRAKFKA